jgi:hypothetical protein
VSFRVRPPENLRTITHVHVWLEEARNALADASGVPREALEADPRTATLLLELTRIAAHASGDRRNAPLLAYLVGIAVGRGARVEDLAAAVRALDGPAPAA